MSCDAVHCGKDAGNSSNSKTGHRVIVSPNAKWFVPSRHLRGKTHACAPGEASCLRTASREAKLIL